MKMKANSSMTFQETESRTTKHSSTLQKLGMALDVDGILSATSFYEIT